MGNTLKCNWQDGLGTSPTGEQCGECNPEFAKYCPALNKEKQIEEMAHILCGMENSCDNCMFTKVNCYERLDAEQIYTAGYRKASEVALKVIGEVEKIIDKYYNRHIFGVEDLSDVEQEAVMNFSDDITGDLAELKKKYIAEDINVTTKESEKDNGN